MKKFLYLLFFVMPLTLLGQWNTTGTNIFNTNTGYVGIGTTTPITKLHVEGNIYVGANQLQFLSTNGGANRIQSAGGSGTVGVWTFKSRFDQIILDAGESAGNERQILFKTGGTDRMLVDYYGNIGIGTTSPQEKLHVNGNIYVGTNQLQFLSTNGGANRIQSAGGSGTFGAWTFKSRFDQIILDAGESAGNERQILFKTGGTDRMLVDYYGNVGIGTTSPDSKLAVKGTVHANEVKVDLNVPGPDYVFEPTYTLPSLDSLQSYINQNKHLPEIPSAREMEANGVNLGVMNMLLLKKVEELTLYVIELKKENIAEHEDNSKLRNDLNLLMKEVSAIKNRNK